MLRNGVGTALGVLLLCAAGCGTSGRESGAEAAASDFLAAVDRGDGAAACAALAPDAAEGLASSEDLPCAEAFAKADVPGGAVESVEVWGDRAQVRTGADVLFLAELDGGWKVAAAECEARGDRPHECEVGA
ncbi:hypothetical protein [Glycomyces paridis]|uniref:Lipoprotein n=1 Tax=Glycomyces paridis TaxID=2126555 RepID=A0A4S8PG61_9ACTN|nr:hypothetical protein [Glycomyces paridis]THV29508.1 hypothetical protein E9998_08340 [Glycomyces paridis]